MILLQIILMKNISAVYKKVRLILIFIIWPHSVLNDFPGANLGLLLLGDAGALLADQIQIY